VLDSRRDGTFVVITFTPPHSYMAMDVQGVVHGLASLGRVLIKAQKVGCWWLSRNPLLSQSITALDPQQTREIGHRWTICPPKVRARITG
jgi:hypothetical protein